MPCTVARFDPGGEWKDVRAQQWIVTPRFEKGPGAEGSHRKQSRLPAQAQAMVGEFEQLQQVVAGVGM